MAEPVTAARAAGVLLHPTSLPSPGVGDAGEEGRRFVRWLYEAGQRYWQILPLVPVDGGGSPYNGLSALAGNPLLLDPAGLMEDGLLPADALHPPDGLPEARVDFPAALAWKDALLRTAHERWRAGDAGRALREAFAAWRAENAAWADDFALFLALRAEEGGRPWTEWPAPLRRREPRALAAARARLRDEVERHTLGQFLFDRQWHALRTAANEAGVRLIGDVPIFVAHDSADVWARQSLFHLDAEGRPTVVSGVPPDYFSETGQRWGNPLYRWDRMAEGGYAWWIERFRRTLGQVDVVRIDHFRGFESYWEVPAAEETALHGRWVPGPGEAFFRALEAALGPVPVIAEDLGLITPEVEALRARLAIPGMRVLQFAFGGDDPANPHLPANHAVESVAYPGTHDNDTAAGWWAAGATDAERAAFRRLAGAPADDEVPWRMIELTLASPAALAVVAAQDLLALGGGARMNTPGTNDGNWAWRLRPGELTPALAERLRALTQRTGRIG